MLSLVSKSIKDASVLRRFEFAAGYLPKDMPGYLDHVIAFTLKGKEDKNILDHEQALQLIENLELLDSGALVLEEDLIKEIVMMKKGGSDAPLGIVLVSTKPRCRNCGMKLYIRGDRPSKVTIYNDSLGTLPGTHYTRYCRRKGCSLQQHYGYYTEGDSSEVKYDDDWWKQSYFLSSRETAFHMDMLRRLDKEILIGQISYRQRAELYNDIHEYGDEEEYYRRYLIFKSIASLQVNFIYNI